MTIENITFIEYYNCDNKDEYNFAIKYSYVFQESIDHFHIGDFMKVQFGLIKDMQNDLKNKDNYSQMLYFLSKLASKNEKELAKEKLLKIVQEFNYMISEIERITEIELLTLAGNNATDEELEAGIENLNPLGVYLQIRELTNGDITKNEQIRSIPYEDCFIELVTKKRLNDYEKNLFEIRQRKLNNS